MQTSQPSNCLHSLPVIIEVEVEVEVEVEKGDLMEEGGDEEEECNLSLLKDNVIWMRS